jgi:hypothetical protein
MKKKKPQITQITLIFLYSFFIICVNLWFILKAVPNNAAPSPGDERKPTPTVCAAYRLPSPRGFFYN